MRLSAVALLAVATTVSAWMPGEHKDILAPDGTNLFAGATLFNTSTTGRSGSKRWLPSTNGGKIRGVNLGSLFVFEPWLASNEWSQMGCGNYKSEFDCVAGIGQSAANAAFQHHWSTWITESDINQMVSYGINTIRIPVGYWMREDIVYSDSEHFPQGGLSYLTNMVGWASNAGLYIIIDLHGLPGAQVAQNSFTGQYAQSPGFYVDWQFERALKFLEWMTKIIHTNNNYRNVGMIEVVNEPVSNSDSVGSMRSSYYPNAFSRIRAVEQSLNINPGSYLHIQMMNNKWGSGDPTQYLTNNYYAAYDDHRYIKWDSSVAVNQQSYISESCYNDDRGGNWPTIVGEWSISVPDNVQWTSGWDPNSQKDFYKKWFAAQVINYERQQGWVFWTWKSQLGDYRWSYQDAVAAGVIPTNLGSVYNIGAC